MKINIRQGVFETNSSSSHSISYNNDNTEVSRCLREVGTTVVITGGEFGWGYEELTTPYEKMQYVLTSVVSYENVENRLHESVLYKWIQEMVLDYSNETLVLEEVECEFYPYGYIDHQSSDLLTDKDYWQTDNEELFKNGIKDLVFSDKYSIIIDNDNH